MMQNFIKNIIREGLVPYLENIIDIESYSRDKVALKFIEYGDGFLYYKEVRYSLSSDYISEYNIDFFKKPKVKYYCNIDSLGKVVISKDVFLHEFIRMLKYENINFKGINSLDRDYYILQTDLKVNIYFDLEEGKLFRIGKLILE